MAAGDRYWEAMDPARAEARSLARAELALGLLERASIRGGTLLDVGCGPGWTLERFSRAGFTARGVEASPAAAARARERGLTVEVLDLESDPLPAGFDLLTAFEVLEHVRDPLRLLRSMAGALAPGGRLLISLPNEFHLLRRLSILAGRPGAAGHRQFGGHDDPHLRLFNPLESERLFAAAGLRVLDRAWDGLAPPRWRAAKPLSAALASLRPSLFALAGVHLLAPVGPAQDLPTPQSGRSAAP
jgi:SAM-dependent methyltransferase